MIPLGIVIANEWGGAQQERLYDLHKSIGALLIPLVIVRVVYRLVHPPPPLPDRHPGDPAIRRACDALGALRAAARAAVVGWIGTSAYPAPVPFFGCSSCRTIWPENRALSEQLFGAAPLARDRDRGRGGDPYRRGAASSFRAQGPRPHAHADRLTAVGARMATSASRSIGDLTSPEVSQRLQEDLDPAACRSARSSSTGRTCRSIPTWWSPRSLTRRIIARWGDALDLWQLPTISISLSREHDWAPGTLSPDASRISSRCCATWRATSCRALPARNLAIVNGHGGNRGVLENLVRELHGDVALNACVIHPFDLAKVERSDQPGRPWRQGRDLGDAGARAATGAARQALSGCASAPTRTRSRRWCSSAARLGRGAATIRGSPSTASSARRTAASAELGRRRSSTSIDRRESRVAACSKRLLWHDISERLDRVARARPAKAAGAGDLAMRTAPQRRRPGPPARTSRRSGSPPPPRPRKKS